MTLKQLIPGAVKKQVFATVRRFGYELSVRPDPQVISQDVDEAFLPIYAGMRAVGGFDMQLYTVYKAVRYLVASGIAGDFIECGVYQGRQVLMMAATLQSLGVDDRDLYLYDTFTGITKPSAEDYKGEYSPEAVQATVDGWRKGLQPDGSNLRKLVSVEEVRDNVMSSGYPSARIHCVKGNVLQTLPNDFHSQIALLRLDTDWYESTKHELACLYDRLAVGGVLIIDDYGRWRGARKAVDEHFATLGSRAPLLCRTGGSERVCTKPGP